MNTDCPAFPTNSAAAENDLSTSEMENCVKNAPNLEEIEVNQNCVAQSLCADSHVIDNLHFEPGSACSSDSCNPPEYPLVDINAIN